MNAGEILGIDEFNAIDDGLLADQVSALTIGNLQTFFLRRTSQMISGKYITNTTGAAHGEVEGSITSSFSK